MSEILVPVSFGELLDKIAILQIKSERMTDPAKLANVRNELDALENLRFSAAIDGLVYARHGTTFPTRLTVIALPAGARRTSTRALTTARTGDLDGDGRAEILARGADGFALLRVP